MSPNASRLSGCKTRYLLLYQLQQSSAVGPRNQRYLRPKSSASNGTSLSVGCVGERAREVASQHDRQLTILMHQYDLVRQGTDSLTCIAFGAPICRAS
jgi:hypothetical protein